MTQLVKLHKEQCSIKIVCSTSSIHNKLAIIFYVSLTYYSVGCRWICWGHFVHSTCVQLVVFCCLIPEGSTRSCYIIPQYNHALTIAIVVVVPAKPQLRQIVYVVGQHEIGLMRPVLSLPIDSFDTTEKYSIELAGVSVIASSNYQLFPFTCSCLSCQVKKNWTVKRDWSFNFTTKVFQMLETFKNESTLLRTEL